MPVDRERYRAIAGSFPTGVAIVTARDADGSPRGLTTQSFVGLSTEPPLMLVAIDKTARTLPALRRAGAFVVNFVKVGSDEVATKFASKSDDKFAGVPWRPSGVAMGAPILHECAIAYAECVITQELEAGDHWILVGGVEGGEVLGGTPLLYYRRTYAGWVEEKPAPQVGP
ncbi:MAG TPA: flavin reductase family protein [Verrucomicrobiae bacterium]|nr:flavin reductase family protein [Verrucomicrobiae bacterium]